MEMFVVKGDSVEGLMNVALEMKNPAQCERLVCVVDASALQFVDVALKRAKEVLTLEWILDAYVRIPKIRRVWNECEINEVGIRIIEFTERFESRRRTSVVRENCGK